MFFGKVLLVCWRTKNVQELASHIKAGLSAVPHLPCLGPIEGNRRICARICCVSEEFVRKRLTIFGKQRNDPTKQAGMALAGANCKATPDVKV